MIAKYIKKCENLKTIILLKYNYLKNDKEYKKSVQLFIFFFSRRKNILNK